MACIYHMNDVNVRQEKVIKSEIDKRTPVNSPQPNKPRYTESSQGATKVSRKVVRQELRNHSI